MKQQRTRPSGPSLRSKRIKSEVVGSLVCQKIGRSRAWLSSVENGYATATPEELEHLNQTIDEIVRTREQIAKLASEAGLSLAGVRL
jgi:hypothetical protein